jgi:nucleoside phosphorylase
MQSIDAIIYTPLEEEFEMLRSKFLPTADINGENFTGYMGLGRNQEKVAVVVGFDWGNDHAYAVMRELLTIYKPKIAICIGIGGGISKDTKLGDVFYSSHVLDLTQRMKFEKDKKGINRTKYDPEPYESSARLKKALDRSRLSSAGKSSYRNWIRSCELVNDGFLVGHNTTPLGHPSTYFKTPTARAGKVASTNAVLADENAVEDVRACGRKMACVDTEGAGFAKACMEQSLREHIVIRGISDMANEAKKIAEENFKNVFRKMAASNAALFLYENLDLMIGEKISTILSSSSSGTSQTSAAQTAIEKNERLIREELSRRSVVFKMIEQEFRMPVPRIRKEDAGNDSTGEKKLPPEQEIEEAVSQNNRILIRIPKHYPDTALPWLFAHLLTEPNNGGRYPIPVCLRWSEYGPPRNNLDAHLDEKGLLFAKNNSSYKIIFIVIDALTGLKTKPQFLSSDFDGYNNASIILFQDRNDTSVIDDEMSRIFQPETFLVEGISFSSITNYVRANFGMSMDESEVLATRLVSTFNTYRLKVHPTYLASIQKDTVLSFIEANQRGELIELAVAGLLSLLVADDQSKVVLRRGTRERFLSRLAVNIYSEKQRYNEDDTINYVSSYAAEMGFDIDPRQFIKSFVDNGILTYEGGYIEISVPVIRSYMLAKGLAAQGAKGLAYFNFEYDSFDVSTFDLYCEFNNDNKIYEEMGQLLDQSIAFFDEKISKHTSVIVDGQFRSELLSKSLNMSKVSNDISEKAAELVEATNLVSEKQAKLDVQFQISQSQAAKSVDLSDLNKFSNEHAAMLRYYAATIMIGSAAEKMSDTIKLSIIAKILKLGGLMSTDLLTLYSKFDIDATIAEVTAQIDQDNAITFETEEARKDFDKFVRLNVELWQFNLAAHPLMVFLALLCEAGRTNVLLSPISRTSSSNKIEEFLRSAWAFDLDPVGQRKLPKELSKKLGKSTFLRTIFGVTMVNRSYWFHHGRQRREALANGIDEIFKPLSLKSNLDIDEDN